LLARITAFLVALGPWGILSLSALDAAIPLPGGLDVLVIFLAAKRPELAWLWIATAVIGSSTGNLALFLLSRKGGARLIKAETPEREQHRFRRWFNRYGLVTVFIPALVPIPMPLKFFVVCSGMLRIGITYFFGTLLLARLLRYGGEVYLGVQMGDHSVQYLSDHSRQLLAIAALLFVFLYLLIRLSEYLRKPAAESGQ
jgi:membrane protein YqaA with SNARE-associated domain